MKRVRVLIAKAGLDGHDRGAKVIARALRDAGIEVVYLGLRNTPEQIVSASTQEDVDFIGISILSGAHNVICSEIKALLDQRGITDVPIIVGGIVPQIDVPKLKALGVAEIFGPATRMDDIVNFVRSTARTRRELAL